MLDMKEKVFYWDKWFDVTKSKFIEKQWYKIIFLLSPVFVANTKIVFVYIFAAHSIIFLLSFLLFLVDAREKWNHV